MPGAADDLLESVREGGLLRPGSSLVAMLSGGRDSTCLLDVAVRVLGAERVAALHVNYGLRDDADADEAHCAALCRRLGVDLVVERPRRPEGPGNLQAWARDSRYAAASGLASSTDASIATGHTADDQVETILYRLASSPSRRALLGMKPIDGKLLRPLLGVTRAMTTAYCEERGLAWRDDPTNEETSFARNRIRHGLAEALAEAHPAAAATSCAPPSSCARRQRSSTVSSTPSSMAPATPPAARSRVTGCWSCPRRCAGSSSSDSPMPPPAARWPGPRATPRRSPAWTGGGSKIDLGSGVRAVLEGGVIRAEQT